MRTTTMAIVGRCAEADARMHLYKRISDFEKALAEDVRVRFCVHDVFEIYRAKSRAYE